MLFKKRFAALIFYQGTAFCGWQKQKHETLLADSKYKKSIQSCFEAALSQIFSEPIRVVASGRTDAGVHALGQVVHFDLGKLICTSTLIRALNGILPQEIRVQALKEVDPAFHAQRSAIKKQYSFYFQQGEVALPHLMHFSWWIFKTLDLQAMRAGMVLLEGEHDFLAFRASKAKPGSSVRQLFQARVEEIFLPFPSMQAWEACPVPRLIRLRLLGSGFLKQMVRGIAGTLLQVGEGRREPSVFSDILATKQRALVGPTAPARALFLDQVWYEEAIFKGPELS